MVSKMSDWRGELGRWLKPFLDRLGHKARRQMCPLYVSGLIGPGDRSDARIVENGFATSGGVSKSAKVVLDRVSRRFNAKSNVQ